MKIVGGFTAIPAALGLFTAGKTGAVIGGVAGGVVGIGVANVLADKKGLEKEEEPEQLNTTQSKEKKT